MLKIRLNFNFNTLRTNTNNKINFFNNNLKKLITYKFNNQFSSQIYQYHDHNFLKNYDYINSYFSYDKNVYSNILTLFKNINSFNTGFFTELIIIGLGFRVFKTSLSKYNSNDNNNDSRVGTIFLNFELHFSHKMIYKVPNNVVLKCNKKKILIFGLSKVSVLNTAFEIKSLRFPNIYKGKGIKFSQEFIKLKPGKQR